MCKNVHGDPADWIKRTQQVKRIGRVKPENGLVARDNHERLQTERTASQLFHTANEYSANQKNNNPLFIFSERKLTFTFAICRRPFVCLSVCV